MDELISRQAAIDAIHEDADWLAAQGSDWQVERMERDKSILKSLPTVQPEIIRCEDCKYFELDHFEKVDGFPIPIIVAHEICMKWGDGCKSSIDGWCFMAERRTDGRTDKQTGGD